MISILDELCRESENLTLLLTCKEQLRRDGDEYIGRTKELVGTLCTFIYALFFFATSFVKKRTERASAWGYMFLSIIHKYKPMRA